jgi:hypothetical protein
MVADMNAMNAAHWMPRGRIYGAVASASLIGYFVVPPINDLAMRTCAGPLVCPTKVARGVYEVLAVAAVISLLAGLLISREIGKHPTGGNRTAGIIFAALTCFFGGIVWIILQAAFW